MSTYVVLARKWRPAQFQDIVGQGPVVRTLMNAIQSERVHHAYLFTGSRGIGKTSTARIFAKLLRCENLKKDDSGLRSCDQCSNCKEITSGTGVDVMEIDGASNNGVDAVREIRESAKYLPSSGKKKVYIIDEVHMLSTAAFNALLKTLEEPPPHVIFVFATTEPHKIPATILSRCQRFDLKRVTSGQIQKRLDEIIRAEGATADPASLALIARAAEGSMRDALSLLDQIIAYSGNQITAQAVRESTGLIESATLLAILKGILSRDSTGSIEAIHQAYFQGHDLKSLAQNLIEYFHALILMKSGADQSTSLEVGEEEIKELRSFLGFRELEELELIFQVFSNGLEMISKSPQPKLILDILAVKCATAEALVSVSSSSSPSPARPTPQPIQTTSSSPAPAKPVEAAPRSLLNAFKEKMDKPGPSQPTAPNPSSAAAAPRSPIPSPASPAKKSAGDSLSGFVAHIRKSRPILASILEHVCDAQMPQADATLTLAFTKGQDHFRMQLQTKTYAEQLTLLSKEFFGKPIQVKIETRETGESMASVKQKDQDSLALQIRTEAENHPIIKEAKSLFGGELGPIEVITQNPGDSDAV